MAKVKLEAAVYDKAKAIVEAAGYGSVDECVAHLIEQEHSRLQTDEPDKNVTDQLRGLGYIE
jgi:predicted negative regulator of RcsB-dependent stress response